MPELERLVLELLPLLDVAITAAAATEQSLEAELIDAERSRYSWDLSAAQGAEARLSEARARLAKLQRLHAALHDSTGRPPCLP